MCQYKDIINEVKRSINLKGICLVVLGYFVEITF